MRHLALMPDEPEDNGPPDFEALARQQARDAQELTQFDASGSPRVPWDDLHDATGHLLPWQWWVLAAMTGQGKSTVLMSLVAHWIAEERPVYMLPLEQPADIMRLYLASIRRGLDPRRVLAGRWSDLQSDAKKLIAEDLAWQASPEGSALLHFCPKAHVGERELETCMAEADVFGAEVVIIDHLHQLDTGTGNGYEGLKRLCRQLNEFAKAFRRPILTAAQVHRGDGDRMAAHQPPKPTAIQGGDVVRQLAHVALGTYRPFAGRPSRADELAIRSGKEIRPYLEPNCVGFVVLKHRIDGEQQGRIVKLRYEHGQIEQPTWEQKERWRMQDAEDA